MLDAFKFNSERYRAYGGEILRDTRIVKIVDLAGTGQRILDLGCQDGTIGELMLQKQNRVWGIDASSNAVPLARARGIDARLGNLEDGIDFPDASFDVVVAAELLEHVFEIGRLLDAIHRVLTPGGHLIATTPNLAAFGRRLLLLFNRNPHIDISYTGNSAGHIRYFVKKTLVSLLREHGFEVEVFTSDMINFTASGRVRSSTLATLFPTLGRSLIVRARKEVADGSQTSA